MHSREVEDPLCFVRKAAYFNAAALRFGRRLHHSTSFPGQIRFNSKSGFNPEFRSRAIGKTFVSPGPKQVPRTKASRQDQSKSTGKPISYLKETRKQHNRTLISSL